MKRVFFIACICGVFLTADAQIEKTLTIEDCYLLARQNYPLARQKELILKSKEYSIENASKGYLPQFSIKGQATYQSDVTEVPIKIPNTTLPTISKDQYKLYTEVDQTISDGGIIKTQKQSIEANAVVEEQKLESSIGNRVSGIEYRVSGIKYPNA